MTVIFFPVILCNFDKNKRRHISLLRFGHKCTVTKEAAVQRCFVESLIGKFTGKRWWWRPSLIKLHVKSKFILCFRRLSRFKKSYLRFCNFSVIIAKILRFLATSFSCVVIDKALKQYWYFVLLPYWKLWHLHLLSINLKQVSFKSSRFILHKSKSI